MTNVQLPSNVGWGQGNRESSSGQGRPILGVAGLEEAALVPPVVVGSFDLNGVVAGGKVARDI
jgi:hypothetical protein